MKVLTKNEIDWLESQKRDWHYSISRDRLPVDVQREIFGYLLPFETTGGLRRLVRTPQRGGGGESKSNRNRFKIMSIH